MYLSYVHTWYVRRTWSRYDPTACLYGYVRSGFQRTGSCCGKDWGHQGLVRTEIPGDFLLSGLRPLFFFLFFLIICGTYLGVPLFPGIQSNQDPRRTQKPTISIFLHTILGPDYDVPGTPVIQLRGYLDSRAPQDNIIRDLDPFSFRLVFLMYRANRHVPPICKVAIP